MSSASRISCGLVALLSALTTAAYASQWTITDLGSLDARTSYATDINNSGQVVGYSTHAGGGLYEHHAVLWAGGTMTDLGVLGGGDWAQARAINESGQVAGYSRVAPLPNWHPFMWQGGVLSDVGSAGGSQTAAYDINGAGWIVGSDNSIGAYYRDGTTFHDLDSPMPAGWVGLYEARGINDVGQVVGYGRTTAGDNRAFLYDIGSGTGIDLGTLGASSRATAISNSGRVVGWSETGDVFGDDENPVVHAFVWYDGLMTDLGTLGGGEGMALGVNETGQVVGKASLTAEGEDPLYAFLWENGQMTNLNDLLPAGSGWVLREATAINDLGQIVGYGTLNGVDRAFLLVPEPSTLFFLSLGALILTTKRRRTS